ncbi:hypothetical protein B566_EDAN016850 [Ephemera danica]|nr:hypothetical protein B566_EDAN016850 [Ephemera danica]
MIAHLALATSVKILLWTFGMQRSIAVSGACTVQMLILVPLNPLYFSSPHPHKMSFRKRFFELSRSQTYKRLRLARNLHESAPTVSQSVDAANEDSSASNESLNQDVELNLLPEGEHSQEAEAARASEANVANQINIDGGSGLGVLEIGHNLNEVDACDNGEHDDFDHGSDNSNPSESEDGGDNVNPSDSEDGGDNAHPSDSEDRGDNAHPSDSEDGSDNDHIVVVGNIENHADLDDGDDDPDDDGDAGILLDNRAELQNKLALWILKNNVSREATAELLSIVRSSPDFRYLPKTRQSLVHTSRDSVVLQDMPPGKYYHFGLEQGLLDAFLESYLDLANGETVQVMVNCDGVSLNKSNFEQFFTILGLAVNLKGSSVFKIGIYHGTEKPRDAETFARPFVNECINIVENGIDYGENHYDVVVMGFVCDMPAQAFLLNTKGHTGFSSCTKCTVVGRTVNRTTCFYDLNCELRTDASFRAKTDEDHHNGNTPITEIPRVDMIRGNPKEPFHLKYVGTMKKILALMFGRKAPRRLPAAFRDATSAEMKKIATFIPSEFQRRPRDLLLLDKFKGTELRLILLYIGPVVLRKILNGSEYNLDLYNNFLTFHVASVILSKPAGEADINYAEQLLRHFVRGFKNIHGEQFISQNIHCLIHVADDVRFFGPLENYSAFVFENENRLIRNVLKNSGEPLKQLVKRHEERKASGALKKSSPPIVGFKCHQRSENGLQMPNLCGPYFKVIEYAKFKLSVGKSNCCFMTEESDVFIMESIAHQEGTNRPKIIARKYLRKVDLYTVPRRSSSMRIFRVGNLGHRMEVSPNKVHYKCLRIPTDDDEFAVFPLLHCFCK